MKHTVQRKGGQSLGNQTFDQMFTRSKTKAIINQGKQLQLHTLSVLIDLISANIYDKHFKCALWTR